MLQDKIKETMLTSLGLEIDDNCLLIKAMSGQKLKFNVKNFDVLAQDITEMAIIQLGDNYSRIHEDYKRDKVEPLIQEIAELKKGYEIVLEDLAEANKKLDRSGKRGQKLYSELAESKMQYLQHDIQMCKINKEADNRIIELEECYENMEDQRDELRKQISEVKFLNRHEVGEILKTIEYKITSYPSRDYIFTNDNFNNFISAICSLAIPTRITISNTKSLLDNADEIIPKGYHDVNCYYEPDPEQDKKDKIVEVLKAYIVTGMVGCYNAIPVENINAIANELLEVK